VSTSRLAGDLMAKFTFELEETIKYVTEVEAGNVFEAYEKLINALADGVAEDEFDMVEKDNTGFDVVNNPYEPLTI
jgi:hypothetical protein